MSKACYLLFSFVAMTLLSGCASITGSSNQSVSVQTREKAGNEISGAACELTNSKGTWFITTPGSVSIHRSNDDLQATCRKEDQEPGRAAIVSETKGSMFGNIIFGGGIGAIIDHSNGSAYEYPTLIQVVMGTFTRIAPPSKPDGDPQASSSNNNVQVATSTSSSATASSAASTKEDQLKELKRLYSEGLITAEAYAEQQKKILDTAK